MVYNKLVRDKIPSIIESQGKTAKVRRLDDEEYFLALEQKLDEEVAEFHKDKNLEELADILEVVYALTENLSCTKEELFAANERKLAQCGGFRDRIFLISNEG